MWGSRVSREGAPYRAVSSCRCNDLRGYRVSRPLRQYLAAFLDHHRHIEPDHRPSRLPVDRGQRVAGRRSRHGDPDKAPHQPVVPIVETILTPPDLAGPPVPLALAGRVPTHVLTTARSRIAKKPPSTDPTTTSSLHADLLGHTARASPIPSRPACGEGRDQPCVCAKTWRTISRERGGRRKARKRRPDDRQVLATLRGWSTSAKQARVKFEKR